MFDKPKVGDIFKSKFAPNNCIVVTLELDIENYRYASKCKILMFEPKLQFDIREETQCTVIQNLEHYWVKCE